MAGFSSPTHQGYKAGGENPFPARTTDGKPVSAHQQFEYGKQCRVDGLTWTQVKNLMNGHKEVDYYNL